jgi:hypothetical protein
MGPNPYDGNRCYGQYMILTDASGRRTPVGIALNYPLEFLDADHLIYATPASDFSPEYRVGVVNLVTMEAREVDVGSSIGEGITTGHFSFYCCSVLGVLPPFTS